MLAQVASAVVPSQESAAGVFMSVPTAGSTKSQGWSQVVSPPEASSPAALVPEVQLAQTLLLTYSFSAQVMTVQATTA